MGALCSLKKYTDTVFATLAGLSTLGSCRIIDRCVEAGFVRSVRLVIDSLHTLKLLETNDLVICHVGKIVPLVPRVELKGALARWQHYRREADQ